MKQRSDLSAITAFDREPAVRQNSRIDELDGLRGLLALWVAVSHIICWCGFADFPFQVPGRFRILWREFVYAGGAVDTFIILSGFVISYLIHSSFRSYRHFITGRFFRIYPVYFFCLLFGLASIPFASTILNTAHWRENTYFQQWIAPTAAAQATYPLRHFIAHLTLLFGMVPERALPHGETTLLPPAWSITLEWQYYLVAPFIAVIVRSRFGILALGAVACAGNFVWHWWSNAFLPAKLALFLVGIGCYHLYVNRNQLNLEKKAPVATAITLSAVFVVAWHWVALSIWMLVFGCIMSASTEVQTRPSLNSLMRKALLNRHLQFLGLVSYPIYLVHYPIIIFVLATLLHFHPGITAPSALAITLTIGIPIVLLASTLLHNWVEAPMMSVGKRFTHTKRSQISKLPVLINISKE